MATSARGAPSGVPLTGPAVRSRSPPAVVRSAIAAQTFAAPRRKRDGSLRGSRRVSSSRSSSSGGCSGGMARPGSTRRRVARLAAQQAQQAQRQGTPSPPAADPFERDSFGQTPLIRAARDGRAAEVKRLLDQGADVGAQDNWGSDALMLAAAGGHAASVQLLLAAGADVRARDCHRRTALHAVSLWGAYTVMVNTAILGFPSASHAAGAAACAQLLVAARAEVDAADDMGFTPLSRLAQVIEPDEHAAATMRLLLGAGAAGRPALEAALHLENLPALELLASARGDDASDLLADKLDFTLRSGMAADEAVMLLRAGAGIGGLPLRLKSFAVELALRKRGQAEG